MLKRAVFILKKENAAQEMQALINELKAHHVEAHQIEVIDRDDVTVEDRLQKCLSEKPEGTLYITDCAFCQKKLHAEKLPVIVYLYQENREEDFSHAEYAIENLNEIEYKSLELAYLRLTGQPWTITETKRCLIRETIPEDVDSFYKIYKESSITEYMEDLYADREEEIAYIRDYIKNVYRFYGYGMWTVIEKENGEIIGRAGISLRDGCDIPELGFVIGVPWQRQGYAYEVCQAVLAYGRKELEFQQFQALIMKGNEKSKRLCEKLGFAFWADVEIDGIVHERMGVCYEG